jgi:hypothetical protein
MAVKPFSDSMAVVQIFIESGKSKIQSTLRVVALDNIWHISDKLYTYKNYTDISLDVVATIWYQLLPVSPILITK